MPPPPTGRGLRHSNTICTVSGGSKRTNAGNWERRGRESLLPNICEECSEMDEMQIVRARLNVLLTAVEWCKNGYKLNGFHGFKFQIIQCFLIRCFIAS